jgi:DNA-binding CsgD family transcriptional regulator
VKKKQLRPPNPNVMKARHEGRFRYIARLMLAGLRQEQIAARLKVTPRNLRYLLSTPEI